MDSSSRQEYPAMLDTLEPSRAMAVLNDRMKHVGGLNSQIADWLQERRRIEEIYATSLRKLAQKTPPDDASELGVFTTPWQKILSSTTSLAESHHALASGLETDIIAPLRGFVANSREVQSISTMHGNLASLAKDYDASQKKADRLNSRAGKTDSNKVANASSDFDNAASQWSSQAPYVFEALQAVDESRCNQLRDILTQYQTLEVDLVTRNRKTAETTLNSILNVETPNEIRTFAARNSGSATSSTGRRPSAISRPSRSSRSGPSTASTAATTLAPPVSRTDEFDRQRSPSVGEEKKSRLSGLKRLGTVVGRRKSMQPQFDRRESGRGTTSSSNLGASVMSNGDQASPGRQRAYAPLNDEHSSRGQERVSDSIGAEQSTSSTRERPSGSIGAYQQTASQELPSDPLGDIQPPPGAPPGRERRDLAPLAEHHSNTASSPPRTSSLANGISQIQEPSAPENSVAPVAAPPNRSLRDADGFAIPPPPSDPISQAQQESLSFGDSTTSAPKATLRDAPITEDQETSESAMASTVARLREQAAQPRRTSTLRGRRDVRSAIFPAATPPPIAEQPRELQPPETTTTLPQTTSISPPRDIEISQQPAPMLTQPSPSSPPQIFNTPFVSSLHSGQPNASSTNVAPHRPSLGEEDNQSIRSGRSTRTMATSIQHPSLTGPGLTSSVIETISAWQEGGSVSRAVVIGEVALANNVNLSDPTSPSAGSTTTNIRIENFSALGKVAPDPIVDNEASSKPGEYVVDLTAIPRTTIAFKYQVHIEPSSLASQAPLLLTPAWRIEPTQSSVILSYAPNPSLTVPITLHNLVLAIHLGSDGARASSCLSKPTGTFSRERNIIYWKLDELIITPGTAPQKMLARFQTEGQATQGQVEARWEARGPTSATLGSGLAISELVAPEADPFADSADVVGDWKEVSTVRKICSGTYAAT